MGWGLSFSPLQAIKEIRAITLQKVVFNHEISLGRDREGSRFSRDHRCRSIRSQFGPSYPCDESQFGWRSDREGDFELR